MFLILSVFTGSLLRAQTRNASISFDKEIHDFGKIKEEDGTVTHQFTFKNTGSVPLIINDVKASCGCTSPSWSKEPILPGKEGYVSTTYNPKNRPGPFNKSITVISNANSQHKVLRITGDVIPRPKTIEDIYRYSMGPIRLKSNHLGFGSITEGQTVTRVMEIINTSDGNAELDFSGVPAHISVKAEPQILVPDQKGIIEVRYDAGAKKDWGFLIDRINVLVNGETDRLRRLTISANITEDFGSWTAEELANAPRVKFDQTTFDFNEIKQGEVVEHEFVISNTGKSNLIIRKIRASCGCTAVDPEKDVLSPGESSKLKVIFSSRGKVGKQNKTITVITNDPKQSRMVLWVKGTVNT